MEKYLVKVCHDYITELQEKFKNVVFKQLERIGGLYITNPVNKSYSNDYSIFTETQIKRSLTNMLSLFVSEDVKKKLSYFSQEEDKDECKIYKLDGALNLQSHEKYAVQNIGHATALIQVPGINILTDPIFCGLNWFLYPEKTRSHPCIEELPKIDVIVISHNHRDHVDENSLKKLLDFYNTKQWDQSLVLVPKGDKIYFETLGFDRIEEVEWFDKVSVIKDSRKSVDFVSIPADHRSGRSGIDHHRSLVNGWVINPIGEDVIFKFSGDTRSLCCETQLAVDAVLWNEIRNKVMNEDKIVEEIVIPDIICLEPSGPNYTRCDMDVTHQSSSYSALLKFVDASNLAKLTGKDLHEFTQKIKTVMVHHKKFEFGPDRFNEGLFVMKKLLRYLDLNDEDLERELARQELKIEDCLEKKKLRSSVHFALRPIIGMLPKQTSLVVHSKSFIVKEIVDTIEKLDMNRELAKKYIAEYLIKNTVFPKIGERLNNEQLVDAKFDVENVKKYCGKNCSSV